MARFKEGVRLCVEVDSLSEYRPIAIAILPTAANRANEAGSTIGLRTDEAAHLIVDLSVTLAGIDHDTTIAALTKAADHITNRSKENN